MDYNRNYKCRITRNLSINGIEALVMENEKLRITILVGKGTDIYEFLYKPLDIDFAWRSPVKLNNPSKFIPSTGNDEGTFLDRYQGGFQEILPSGGPACEYKGAKIGMHGEVSNIPWDYLILEDTEDIIKVKFSTRTYRTPFFIEKVITLKTLDSTVYLEEELVNEGNEEMEFMWGHHPAIGNPFLSDKCSIKTNANKIIVHPEKSFDRQRLEAGSMHEWPIAKNNGQDIDFSKVPSMDENCADLVYLTDFEDKAMYEIHNSEINLSFGMKWDKKIFNYLWMWQVCGGGYGYPWYGRTYNLAMEPWTSFPSSGLTEAIKNGSSFKLDKKERVKTKLEFFVKQIMIPSS